MHKTIKRKIENLVKKNLQKIEKFFQSGVVTAEIAFTQSTNLFSSKDSRRLVLHGIR